MRAYKTIRLSNCPDVADQINEGRKTHLGHPRRSLSSPAHKRAARRHLKRIDRRNMELETYRYPDEES